MVTALALYEGPHTWCVLISQSEQVYLLPIAVSVME